MPPSNRMREMPGGGSLAGMVLHSTAIPVCLAPGVAGCLACHSQPSVLAHLLTKLLDDPLSPRPGQFERPRRVGDVRHVHNHAVQEVAVLPLVYVRNGFHLAVEVLEQLKVDGHIRGQHHVDHQLPTLRTRGEGGGRGGERFLGV